MLSDPICALATPPGRSAIAVVRLSGRGAFDLLRRLLGLDRETALPAARVATLTTLYDPRGRPIDRALVTCFPGPGSYTGEDLVECSCHGGVLAPALLLAALHELGARPAAPGEFTRRALQNGRLDLLQAEAIADLVDATAAAQGRAALFQLGGGLSRRVADLRNQLIEAQALLSYDIDFPEEDDGPVDPGQVQAALGGVADSIDGLLATASLGERLMAGALVVLAGRPNVGKSSLFNALLGRDRALVTEIPGTTRDTIESPLDLDGWPVRLADTAGLRDSTDRLERLGIEVSRRYLAAADLVLLCVDGARELDEGEREVAGMGPCLVVRTKADLDPGSPGLSVSSVTGAGLGELRRELSGRLFAGLAGGGDLEPLLTRERHRLALATSRGAIGEARVELAEQGDAVLAAHHVRRAVTALDELIGLVDVDEVLDRVFARFCVGK